MSDKLTLDGVELSADTDFSGLVRQILGQGYGARPNDFGNAGWLHRWFETLLDTPFARPISTAVAECLDAPDETWRIEATRFFLSYPDAAGCEKVVLRVAHLQEEPSPAIRGELLTALGAVAGRGNADAISLAKTLAQTEDPTPFIAGLTFADPDWAIEHAESIVESYPTAGLTILFNLQDAGRDVTDVGVRIAKLAKRDREFARNLHRWIDDEKAVAAIKKAMR